MLIVDSDTTSSATTCLLHRLALNPEICKKLQDEIDNYKTNHKESDHFSMSKLKYLQACIDESLRLTPVVMSGLQRMTPPEGMQLGDVFIPGDTIFRAPSYTMYRGKDILARI